MAHSQPIHIALLALLLAVSPVTAFAAEKLIIDGSTGVKPLVEALAAGYTQTPNAHPTEIGAGLKPQARIQALADNKINIAMASHGINIEQITDLGLQLHRIAKMAVVIGVNHNVSVTEISHRQLCEVYRGEILNWQQLGGSDAAIIAFLRPLNEVDVEVLMAQIPCFSQISFASRIQSIDRSGQMARAIAQTPGAIGMTTQVRVAQSNGNISALSIGGIEPDTANLLSGAYPLTRDSYLITAAKPSAAVAAFLDFIRSEQGKNIITANNAVPAG